MCMLGRFSHVRLLASLRTVAHQVPLSMGFVGKNTAVGCHSLLQEIFLTQVSNPHLCVSPALQVDSLLLSYQGRPYTMYYTAVRKNEKMAFAAIGMDVKIIILK